MSFSHANSMCTGTVICANQLYWIQSHTGRFTCLINKSRLWFIINYQMCYPNPWDKQLYFADYVLRHVQRNIFCSRFRITFPALYIVRSLAMASEIMQSISTGNSALPYELRYLGLAINSDDFIRLSAKHFLGYIALIHFAE